MKYVELRIFHLETPVKLFLKIF